MVLIPTRYSFFAIVVLLTACSRPSLIGQWKATQVKILDHGSKSFTTFDVSDPEALTHQLRLAYEKFPEEAVDAREMESGINSTAAAASKTGLILSPGRDFFMESYGFIVPKVLPGWNFGDQLVGKWTLAGDTLSLILGEEEPPGYTFRFIVLEHDSRTLRLRELFADGSTTLPGIPGNEISFVRE